MQGVSGHTSTSSAVVAPSPTRVSGVDAGYLCQMGARQAGDRPPTRTDSGCGNAESVREVALAELKYHRERLASGSEAVASIGNYVFFLVGAGLLAATQLPAAIVVIPLFWSAWLLLALQRAWDSMKHEEHARWLEDRINETLDGAPVVLWNTVSAHRSVGRPLVTLFNFSYWVLLNMVAWVVSVFILVHEHYVVAAWGAAATCVLVYVACLIVIGQRERALSRLRQSIALLVKPPASSHDEN